MTILLLIVQCIIRGKRSRSRKRRNRRRRTLAEDSGGGQRRRRRGERVGEEGKEEDSLTVCKVPDEVE